MARPTSRNGRNSNVQRLGAARRGGVLIPCILAFAACGGNGTATGPGTGASATAVPTSTAVTTATGTGGSASATASVSASAVPATPAAIVIEQPAAGATVHSPLHVTGNADTFEAQFVLELHDPAGRVLSSQPVHATSGTGTRGTFDATVTFTARGLATLVAYERSARDGSAINVVRVAVTLA